jgi:DNA-binding NtrC family response regulator
VNARLYREKNTVARILIVEDEPLIAELLSMYVEEIGHEVVGPAGNIKDAFAIMESDPFEFAILDCSLGKEESTPIAEVLANRNLPFAFATGRGAHALPEKFKTWPMIPKPYIFEDVERILSSLPV